MASTSSNEILELTLDGTQLPIMESFYTIQGEGACTGQAAYFIRVGGCDVGCVWCDVKESWAAGDHPTLSVDAIVAEASKHSARIAVITGGEPLMYNMAPLTQALIDEGFRVHLETSGAYPLTGTWHWICTSPKKFKVPTKEALQRANELKVIAFNKHDLDWAAQHAEKVNEGCLLFIQPEWDQREKMMPLLVQFVKENPRWRMSLQTHKYLNIP